MDSVRLLILIIMALAVPAQGVPPIHINWDRSTLVLVEKGGVYGRMTRVGDGLLCCFEHGGSCQVRHSSDEGKTWQPAVKAVSFEFGNAANPELLHCRDGQTILFYNQRPIDRVHPFAIAMVISRDNGATWGNSKTVFEAGISEGGGCYEPSAVQLPSGEIQLFFANEYTHQSDGTQEITLARSTDNGSTWHSTQAVSFRAGHRDGMPVPVVLLNQKGIAFAIEDNGVTSDGEFKPTIVHSTGAGPWWGKDALGPGSPQRWPAVDGKWPDHVYAGAPYLRQLNTGETVLSCQFSQDGTPPQMAVFIGDAEAKHFAGSSNPFPIGEKTKGMWNSIFVKNHDTVTAVSSTQIAGVRGVWAIDGHVVRSAR